MKKLVQKNFKIICFLISILFFPSFANTINAIAYCVPNTVNGCSSGDNISLFSIKGESGVGFSNNSGAGCSAVPLSYSDFTASFSPVILSRTNSYSGNLQTGNANDYATIWIDFDDDGTFENNERLLNNLKIGTINKLYAIRIPDDATLGQHRLRVRIIGSVTSPVTITDPCASYADTETEDYLIEIIGTSSIRSVALGLANSCTELGAMTINAESNNNGNYPVYLVDSDNNYAAAIYTDGNNLGTVQPSFFKNANATRQDITGRYFLDRNLTILVETQPISTYRFRYFYKISELNGLIAQPGSGVTSQFDLVMTKSNHLCTSNFVDFLGILKSIQFPTGFGSYNGDRFLDFVGLTSFSSFFLHGGSTFLGDPTNPLPVNLIAFFGKNFEKNINQLNWEVTNEKDFLGYEIQKSTDSQHFEKIDFVKTNNSEKYQYEDILVNGSSINYYRLKLIDLDGKFSFSKIIALKNEAEIKIFPNPVKNNIMIENSELEIFEIINAFGQIKNIKSIKINNTQQQINISELPVGIYYLKVGNHFRKIIKE